MKTRFEREREDAQENASAAFYIYEVVTKFKKELEDLDNGLGFFEDLDTKAREMQDICENAYHNYEERVCEIDDEEEEWEENIARWEREQEHAD